MQKIACKTDLHRIAEGERIAAPLIAHIKQYCFPLEKLPKTLYTPGSYMKMSDRSQRYQDTRNPDEVLRQQNKK